MNGPTGEPDAEEDYNRWYDEVHIPDFLAVPGVLSARRYKVIKSKLPQAADLPYIAAYEIETDSIETVFATMEGWMRPFTPAFDRSKSVHVVAVETGSGRYGKDD